MSAVPATDEIVLPLKELPLKIPDERSKEKNRENSKRFREKQKQVLGEEEFKRRNRERIQIIRAKFKESRGLEEFRKINAKHQHAMREKIKVKIGIENYRALERARLKKLREKNKVVKADGTKESKKKDKTPVVPSNLALPSISSVPAAIAISAVSEPAALPIASSSSSTGVV